jgi:hypothetical protein
MATAPARFPTADMEKPPRECPRRCQRISQIHSRADLRYQQSTPPPPSFRIFASRSYLLPAGKWWTIRKAADQTSVNSEQLEQFIQM